MRHIHAPGMAGASRLRIYRNNLRDNFSRALRLTFPVVHRLVGADYFRQTAQSFQHRYPSRSGDLTHAGKSFPDYLGELHRADRFRYLSDVARLEWLIQESSLAADHAPLNLELLAGVDPSRYESLEFKLHPALRLFESPFPAHAIWEANVAENEDPPDIDLAGGGDRLAILRRPSNIEFLRLSEGELAFLRSLRAGVSFAAALTCGLAADPRFDASSSLQRCVAAEAVVDFSAT
jgi:hypothetical protein